MVRMDWQPSQDGLQQILQLLKVYLRNSLSALLTLNFQQIRRVDATSHDTVLDYLPNKFTQGGLLTNFQMIDV